MRHIPVGVEARLPGNVIPSARKPRMPALDRVLYLQAGVQDQVRTNHVKYIPAFIVLQNQPHILKMIQ